MEREIISIEEAARRLGVNRSALYQAMQAGREGFDWFRCDNNRIRVVAYTLERYEPRPYKRKEKPDAGL